MRRPSGSTGWMLGRVDPQGSLLETRVMRRHLVTKGSFYERLADHGHEIVADEDFAHLYAQGKGRPSVPPSVMVRAMLCATHDRTSDAETSRRTRVDSDWKAAMGVDDFFEGIGATTFSLMRARMVAHDADGALFEKTLRRAVDAGIFKGPLTAIIDSSPVHGAGALASTYELVRKLTRRLARALGEHLDAAVAVAALAAAKPDIDWADPAERKAHLAELVDLAASVLGTAAADSELMADPEVAEAAGLVSQVVLQDVEQGEHGPAVRQGVAPDRVVSHSDPEMRHGRKSASRRFDGHKLDVMVDEASEVVLGVDVRAGNAGDGEGAAPLLAHVTLRASNLTNPLVTASALCSRPGPALLTCRPSVDHDPRNPPVANSRLTWKGSGHRADLPPGILLSREARRGFSPVSRRTPAQHSERLR